MESTTNNEETTRPAMIINLAKRNANPDEEREYAEEPGEDGFNRWAAAGYGEPDDEEGEGHPYGWD